MRNIIGTPAEGDDFFDRPKILAKLRRELENQANILLVAPRRVGKTSLVLRLCEQWNSDPARKAIFLNVEGRSDELAFAERLVGELARVGLHPEILTRAMGVLTKIRQGLSGKGVKIPGLEVSLGEAADADLSTLSKMLESIFRKIEDGDKTVLIVVDELPELLLTLQKEADGAKRVISFLHWLRELRQTYRGKIRWLFLGSIGLDNFVEEQKLQKTINDLQVFTLDAFSLEEADAFLKRLGESNGLTLADSEREEIIRLVGWPLAYHLHLVFHELREMESARSISKAFEYLLQPQKLSYFDTWYERIDTQFSPADAAMCKAVLGLLCKHPAGCDRGQILSMLMTRPTLDLDKIEEKLSRLLIVLQRDGYLFKVGDRYAFRSYLLREYWARKYGL